MGSPDISVIKRAIKERRLQDALELCNSALDATTTDLEVREVTRLRAQTFARLKRPSEGAADLSKLIERGLGEPEDFFSAALYLLRDDDYASALDFANRGEEANAGDRWFAEEFLFLRGYCSLMLGDDATALAIAAKLPDDFQIIVKPLAPPLTKRDLVRES